LIRERIRHWHTPDTNRGITRYRFALIRKASAVFKADPAVFLSFAARLKARSERVAEEVFVVEK
jgi:hypothetical protein